MRVGVVLPGDRTGDCGGPVGRCGIFGGVPGDRSGSGNSPVGMGLGWHDGCVNTMVVVC